MPGCYPPPALSNYSSATDLQLKGLPGDLRKADQYSVAALHWIVMACERMSGRRRTPAPMGDKPFPKLLVPELIYISILP
jgi:hypothetical protein